MSTVISTVLISAPVAFMVGWVLSKAVASHLSRGEPRKGSTPKIATLKNAEPIGVDDRDAQIAELQRELDLAEARIVKSKQNFKTWRERLRPVAQQFRQQRMIISELRDELRRRDAVARQTKENPPADTTAAARELTTT